MQTLHLTIHVNANREIVWHTMLDDATYRIWTASFNPGCYYQGNWEKWSKMLFLGPDPSTGKEGGMVSRIAENRAYEFISIEHLGLVVDGIEDTTSEAAKIWSTVYENYTFHDTDGWTEVSVDMNIADEYVDMFRDMWQDGLATLKKLAEA